jgi:hypothetical protein
VSDSELDAGRQAAAKYLHELLLRQGRYRPRWERFAERVRPGRINHLAVADVLAQHLWNAPRASGDADVLPRQLKDTVGRALSGRLLSRATLTLFIEAFGISRQEEERLWRLWGGSGRISVLSGPRAMASEHVAEVTAALGPRRHQTLSLHDHHEVGPHGLPTRTRTLQVIESTVDGLDRIPYIYDTNALTLEVGQGCQDLTGPLYQISEGLYGTDIPLARSLGAGETLTLEYWTTYHYHGYPQTDEECQYRRAVMRRLENFDMRVEFHPDRVPASVWWATWDGMEGGIIEQEKAFPDGQHSVHRYLRSVERAVVGFYWSWEPPPGGPPPGGPPPGGPPPGGPQTRRAGPDLD